MPQGVPAPEFGVVSGVLDPAMPLLPPGCPVVSTLSGLAKANADASTQPGASAVGLLMFAAGGSEIGKVRLNGVHTLTTTQWDVVTGQSGGLTVGAIYYVGTESGFLSDAPAGSFSWPVGTAISSTQMQLAMGAGGGGSVDVDGVTIGGDGQPGDPLHAIFPGFYDNVRVLTDGSTIIGSGLTGDPLIATGGAPGTTHVQPFSYTVTGLEPDLANITIPIVPSQPDGNYQVAVEQGAKTFFLVTSTSNKLAASFILNLSGNATVGDVFDITILRA